MKRLCYGVGATAVLSFGACADTALPPDDFGYEGTGIAVAVAPLDLDGVNDACYSFEIKNGLSQRVVARGSAQDPSGNGVAGQFGDGGPTGLTGREAQPLCSSRFGDNGGGISYVAPCDASSAQTRNHEVRLWVNAVCEDGSLSGSTACTPMRGYQNPCGNAGCTVTTTCVEDSDVPVQFNFTIMASAQQGFFDVAVRFDEVFCSAKIDTCYPNQQPINLLFDASGNEVQTAVAAIACTSGTEDLQTRLFHTTFQATCGSSVYTLPLATVNQEGNINLTDASGNSLRGAVYFGSEALINAGGGSANKVFTNIAFALPATGACDVEWFVVPTDDDICPVSADGSAGKYRQVAGVRFDATVEKGSGAKCTNAKLDESSGKVATDYVDATGVEPYSSRLSEGAQAFAPSNCGGTTPN